MLAHPAMATSVVAQGKLDAAKDDPTLLVDTHRWFIEAYRPPPKQQQPQPFSAAQPQNQQSNGDQDEAPADQPPELLLQLAEICIDHREFDMAADLAAKIVGQGWGTPPASGMQLCRARLCEAQAWAAAAPTGQSAYETLITISKAMEVGACLTRPLPVDLALRAAGAFWKGARPVMASHHWKGLLDVAKLVAGALQTASDAAPGQQLVVESCICQLVLARCLADAGKEGESNATLSALHHFLAKVGNGELSRLVVEWQLSLGVQPASIAGLKLGDPLLDVEVRV